MKIHVLTDHVANMISAGEVVERPASVAKELVENALDAGARRVEIQVEGGGRRLLRLTDNGEGMTRDDAVLAFERHATSKIRSAEDLAAIGTLGFRGEALASIAAVARVELVTAHNTDEHGTRVNIEGGRMRDVQTAPHPQGTTITVRDLFFNTPARRKFLRSEATENFHLTNLVTHYALANHSLNFTLINNGRESLRATPVSTLRERVYQIFGEEFLESLLEIHESINGVGIVRGYTSAPRERRSSRDGQYLFVNGRFVRDRLLGRALSEGYRSVLPHGVYPSALLFLEVPLEEVDTNVHPAKTEVRFRRAAAIVDLVSNAVRKALAGAGVGKLNTYVAEERYSSSRSDSQSDLSSEWQDLVTANSESPINSDQFKDPVKDPIATDSFGGYNQSQPLATTINSSQSYIDFGFMPVDEETNARRASDMPGASVKFISRESADAVVPTGDDLLPPLDSATELLSEVRPEKLGVDIRPVGQIENSFIIAIDKEGLLLIDQHVAHERILFDKYRAQIEARPVDSQQLLIPETFDLTPAQATVFDSLVEELEICGFGLMRLSGRTVAIKSIPVDLPVGEARNLLAELLDTIDTEKKGSARAELKNRIAASLACRAAIKINMPLAQEKMQWLIDRLLLTSSPTTCPHGRPIILRLSTRDLEKGFHRS